MILRKMDQDEHGKTRRLWEEVFAEDTPAFLDYYYFIKTKDNSIYVVEEDDDIQAMLQLNPYQIAIERHAYASYYIIAVATRKKYRGRGYMGNILRRALKDMYEEKIPFTFLMPAAEAIYTPYDFRFVYSQKIGEISVLSSEQDVESSLPETEADVEDKGGRHSEEIHIRDCVRVRDAALWDAENMASFFNCNFADRWQVCTVRDADYYRTMILEQQSEQGGVRLLFKGEQIVGMFAWAGEDGLEIREPLYLEGYGKIFADEVRKLSGDKKAVIKVYGCMSEMHPSFLASAEHPEETAIYRECVRKPCIMARIVCLPALFSALKADKEASLDCSIAVIDPILTGNSRIWRLESPEGEEDIRIRETEDSDGVIAVAELTELLFGRKTLKELKCSDGVIISDRLECELSKIRKLKRVFLNEVV